MRCTQVLPLCEGPRFGLANMDFNSSDVSALISLHGHEATWANDAEDNICPMCTQCGSKLQMCTEYVLLHRFDPAVKQTQNTCFKQSD